VGDLAARKSSDSSACGVHPLSSALALAVASENDIAVDDDDEGEEIVAFGAAFDTNPVVVVVVVASWRPSSA
jgi:hypothetical protein